MSNNITNNARTLPEWRNLTHLRGDSLDEFRKTEWNNLGYDDCWTFDSAVNAIKNGDPKLFNFDDFWVANATFLALYKRVTGVKGDPFKGVKFLVGWDDPEWGHVTHEKGTIKVPYVGRLNLTPFYGGNFTYNYEIVCGKIQDGDSSPINWL